MMGRSENHEDAISASELMRRAAQIDVVVPPGAQARVWRGIERRRARAAWRLAFPMFALGAASAALLFLWMRPKALPPVAAQPALALLPGGARAITDQLPLLAQPALIDLRAAGKLVEGADTVARLDRFEPGKVELSLVRGSLLVHVNPRAPGESFLVRTPGFQVRVVGTVFRVAVGPRGASLSVGHGTVELMRAGSPPLLVHGGERWPLDSSDVPGAAELELLRPDLEGATFAPVLHVPSESELYAAGLKRLHAHDLRGALASWREQRAHYPHGLLKREAQASIIDALVALREDTQARAEVDAYLREAPDSLRAAEMHFVRGTLLFAADHSCHRAAGEFDRALSRPADPWAERARAARAACRAKGN